MSTADVSLMTAEEFLALPDDGKERMLICGQLYEGDETVTYRNRFHSWVVGRITYLLWAWLDDRPQPRGSVFSGEAGCFLRRDPDTIVGIDVAYFSAEVVERQTDATSVVDGPPILAVEVLSPSDKQQAIHAKVAQYLDAGTLVVWIVDPQFRTVQVHQPGQPPMTFNETQTLSDCDALPGLQIALTEIFPS